MSTKTVSKTIKSNFASPLPTLMLDVIKSRLLERQRLLKNEMKNVLQALSLVDEDENVDQLRKLLSQLGI